MTFHSLPASGLRFLTGALLVLLAATTAEARELYWQELAIEAELDADGALHVVELQSMVFTGDWNGGERRFRIGPGQELTVHGVYRLDRDGQRIPMLQGDLDRPHQWNWAGRSRLRWRSRLPDDPLFAGTPLQYVLEYTLTGILRSDGQRYTMAHDFAFSERPGPIRSFSLDLRVDPAWQPLDEPAECCELSDLPPGRGVVIERSFARTEGAAEPAHVVRTAPAALRHGLFGLALLAMAALGWKFVRDERRAGRFESPRLPSTLDRDWLDEHVFSQPPEVIGALWDDKIGRPEVAAILARLELEGKLRSRVEPQGGLLGSPRLHLELLVPLGELGGYDRKLLRKLFFGGRKTTDTHAIRKHYNGRGFSPVDTIKQRLESKVQHLLHRGSTVPDPSIRPTFWLFAAAAGCLVLAALQGWASAFAWTLMMLFASVIPAVAGLVGARWWRRRIENLGPTSLVFVLPAVVILGLCFVLSGGYEITVNGSPAPLALLTLAAMALFPVAFLSAFLLLARTRQAPEALDLRRRLAGARRLFRRELRQAEPALDDAWLPYLLAFGLHRRVDHWWKDHGRFAQTTDTSSAPSDYASLAGGSWTGGGGSFGGAGATASWGAAAAGLAAGVSAPSSSSSGGFSGGGSSGGGGGGGW